MPVARGVRHVSAGWSIRSAPISRAVWHAVTCTVPRSPRRGSSAFAGDATLGADRGATMLRRIERANTPAMAAARRRRRIVHATAVVAGRPESAGLLPGWRLCGEHLLVNPLRCGPYALAFFTALEREIEHAITQPRHFLTEPPGNIVSPFWADRHIDTAAPAGEAELRARRLRTGQIHDTFKARAAAHVRIGPRRMSPVTKSCWAPRVTAMTMVACATSTTSIAGAARLAPSPRECRSVRGLVHSAARRICTTFSLRTRLRSRGVACVK